MKVLTQLPPIPHEEIDKLMQDRSPVIWGCSVVVCIDESFICSGVFAYTFGVYGIITARHCADMFLSVQKFTLSVAAEAHHFYVESRQCEIITVGDPDTDRSDLCFVAILDKNILLTICEQGYYFYNLDDYERFKDAFKSMPPRVSWVVAGNPEAHVAVREVVVNGQTHKVITAAATVVTAFFLDYEFDGGFDIVKLMLPSAVDEFPHSYKGFSGGGVWHFRFLQNDDNSYAVDPVLAGVVFAQAEPRDVKGVSGRMLTGHGWVSLYAKLRKAVYEWHLAIKIAVQKESETKSKSV